MSAPFDRPAHGEPGGCECMACGVIFIGAPWHDRCAVCAQAGEAGTAETGTGSVHEHAVTAGDAP